MANTNEITIAKANTEATTDYIVKIREIAKGKKDYSEAFNATREYLAAEKGALKWLLEAKIKFDDHIVINKQFNFNPSDMIGDIITRRVRALEKVALDINLEDVLEELESVAWCCGISE